MRCGLPFHIYPGNRNRSSILCRIGLLNEAWLNEYHNVLYLRHQAAGNANRCTRYIDIRHLPAKGNRKALHLEALCSMQHAVLQILKKPLISRACKSEMAGYYFASIEPSEHVCNVFTACLTQYEQLVITCDPAHTVKVQPLTEMTIRHHFEHAPI